MRICEDTVLAQRYRIKKLLGEGGMSSVWLAEDSRLPGLWAVKLLKRSLLESPGNAALLEAFRREAEILSTLSHPNLPKVVDYFSEDGNIFLVEEFIEGKNLEEMVAEGEEFTEEEVIRWGMELCDALSYLHARGIIYRDLKPSNILITKERRPMIVDFGIARMFVCGKDKDTLILGTPGYSPPEQYGQSQTDARSDVYSLGATLHFLLTRHDPGLSPFHFFPPSTLNHNVSHYLDDVIMKALELAPARRFSSVEEMKKALSKEEILVKEQVFSYDGHADLRMHGRILACISFPLLGLAGFSVVVLSDPILFFTPIALLGILFMDYYSRLARNAVKIEVNPFGIQYIGRFRRIHATWRDVKSLIFCFDQEGIARSVRVVTERGGFEYRIDYAARCCKAGSDPLRDNRHLTEIIIRKANLKLREPGSRIYEK